MCEEMSISLEQWWASKLPVTKLVIAATALVSLSGLLAPRALSPSSILSNFAPALLVRFFVYPVEWLANAFLAQLFDVGLGFAFVVNIFVVSHFSQVVEADVFYSFSNDVMYFPRRELFTENNAPADGRSSPVVSSMRYMWFLLVYGVMLVVANSLLVSTRGCLSMLLSYVWCRLQPKSALIALPFVNTKVSVRSYPLVLIGMHFLMGQQLVSDLVAVVLGHVFCYTLYVRRRDYGDAGRRVFDVPVGLYAAVKRSYMSQFDRLRQEGRVL